MTLAQIRTMTRRMLAEEVAADSFWDDPDLDEFINWSYNDIVVAAELLQCNSRADAVAAVDMPDDGEYAMPGDTLKILRAFFKSPLTSKFIRLDLALVEEMDLLASDWFTQKAASTTDIPTHCVLRGQLFHLVPAPIVSGTQNILLWCIQAPAPLAVDGDIPKISSGYHKAIAAGGAFAALDSDRTNPENVKAAARLQARYNGMVALARSQHLLRTVVPRIRDPRDAFLPPSGWRT